MASNLTTQTRRWLELRALIRPARYRRLVYRSLVLAVLGVTCLIYSMRHLSPLAHPRPVDGHPRSRWPREVEAKPVLSPDSFSYVVGEIMTLTGARIPEDSKRRSRDYNQPVLTEGEIHRTKENHTTGGRESLPRVSVVLSLYNFLSGTDAVLLLIESLRYFPDELVSDVLVVADDRWNTSDKDVIEEAVDLCASCRLFFLQGSIYHTRNVAAKFAREEYIVFLDSRVQLSDEWLHPMLGRLVLEPHSVLSPRILLVYANTSVHSVGIASTKISWNLEVVRGHIEPSRRRLLLSSSNFFNQSAISKEIFVIRKDFFLNLGMFDVVENISGMEDVTFSLKVLHCGGNILQSLTSTAFLRVEGPGNWMQADFYSGSFQASVQNKSLYGNIPRKVWLDQISTKISACVLRPSDSEQTDNSDDHQRQRMTYYVDNVSIGLKQWSVSNRCQVANFLQVMERRQRAVSRPVKFSTFHGYVRSLDGMFAFGISSPPYSNPSRSRNNPSREPVWGDLILTRNSSLWLGPFSFSGGAMILNRKFCVTASASHRLTLTKCVQGQLDQNFLFKDNVLKLERTEQRCVQAKRSNEASVLFTVEPCDGDAMQLFKFDVEFLPNCVP